ncbi:MAG: aldehyde ferredoxin oxidoreductase [Chloroflexi bacterium]|nr:aldehyde ferredoxin oxidoreductase [Chloroflexota bacterium]
MQMLRVNMDDLRARREEIPEPYRGWAGRGFLAKVLEHEIPPTCNPLGHDNKLTLANGFFAGTRLSSAGRLSAGGKSPLTGGAKESNAGGTAGDALARIGLRAIVVEGRTTPGGLYVLVVGKEKAELVATPEYARLGTFELCRRLQDRFGPKVSIICIGPAGEMKLGAAGIAVIDQDGFPNRYAGRGALGALMGSKGLKAVVVEESRDSAPMHDPQAFKEAQKAFNKAILESPATARSFPELGTMDMFNRTHRLGAVPTRNFRTGTFEKFDDISPERMRDTILARGGEGTPTHACMAGCMVRCSNIFPDQCGKTIVSPIEYENAILLGENLGIGSFDAIARLNYLCNDLGLDTIETGAALGVAMEAGIIPFDSFEDAERLLQEIGQGTPLGRIVGQGACTVGKVYGVDRTPAVKGQGIPAYDPRAIKGMGVTYLTSPMGADHTAGHTVKYKVDHHLRDGQTEVSRESQIDTAKNDTLNLCSFVRAAIDPHPEVVVALYNAVYGTNHSTDFLRRLGLDTLRSEIKFNRAAGLTWADDRYPDFFLNEKLPPYDVVFDVPYEEIDHFWDFLDEA